MTALRLFEIEQAPPPPPEEAMFRAYCPSCRNFTVEPETNTCFLCRQPKDRRYDYVDVSDDE